MSEKYYRVSYLQNCEPSESYYSSDTRTLTTICNGSKQAIPVDDSCIGSERDIIFNEGSLQCVSDVNETVIVHSASMYLPRGNLYRDLSKDGLLSLPGTRGC